MAQKPLLVLTAVDVRRATDGGVSRANTIATLTMPAVKRQLSPHNPGGGVMEVDFAQRRIQKLEPAFSAKGLDDDLFDGMGRRDIWTFASSYEDPQTGLHLPARGVIEGIIGSWEPDESDPAEFKGCNYMFSEVTHFEFELGEVEMCYFDFYEREGRFKGRSIFEDVRRALGA